MHQIGGLKNCNCVDWLLLILNGLYFEGPDGKVYLVKNDRFVDVANTKYNSNK